MEEGDDEQNPLLKEQNEDHHTTCSIGVVTTTSMSSKSSGVPQSSPQQQEEEEDEEDEEQQQEKETFSAEQQMWLHEEVRRILGQEALSNRRSSTCTDNQQLDHNEVPTQEGNVEEDILVMPLQEPSSPRLPEIYRKSGSIFFNSFRTNIHNFCNVWKDTKTLRKCMLSVQFSIVIYILFRQVIALDDGRHEFENPQFDVAIGILFMFWKIFEVLWNLYKTPQNCQYWSMLCLSIVSVVFACVLLVGTVMEEIQIKNRIYDRKSLAGIGWIGLTLMKGLEAIYVMLCCRCNAISSSDERRDTAFQAFLQCIGTGLQILALLDEMMQNTPGYRISGAFFICLATISQIDSLDQDQPNKGNNFRNIWNTIFKIFTSISFMIATDDRSMRFSISLESVSLDGALPFVLLIACQFFDGHKMMTVAKHMSPVNHIFFFLPTSGKETGEGERHPNRCYQLIVRSILAVCYFILPLLVIHTAGSILWISLITLWSLIRCRIVVKEERKISSFHTASYIYLFFTLVALLVQAAIFQLYSSENDYYMGNVIGAFYLIHTFCWIQVKFSNESEVMHGDDRREKRFRLTKDTYTFMLFADSFSRLYGWLGLIVFLLQATLIGMILVTQWDQYQQSNHFLDVPFDVSLSTRIGQFAGMFILIFYQNDYWVSSSLFEISLTTEGGLEIVAEDNLGSRRNVTKLSKWSTNATCLLRLLLSVLVILSSTVLLIQSNNIIDLVKDYTAIFFVSEIDEVVFKLTHEGYLGMKLQEKAKEVKGVELKDIAQYVYRSVAFMIIFTAMLSLWIVVVTNQINGTYFLETDRGYDCSLVMKEYGYDWRENLLKFNDGSCDIEFNYIECDFDGGDCTDTNFLREIILSSDSSYENCTAQYKMYIGNGRCDGDKYNTEECGWDGGDCVDFNKNYRNCTVDYPHLIGDGVCNFIPYNTAECGWDGGDCKFYNDLPNCTVDNLLLIGDKKCDLSYNYEGCGFDGGDCVFLNKKYPNCSIENLNNGDCPVGIKFLDYFPMCRVDRPSWIGDKMCDSGDYNTLECGWDGGDCLE